MWGDTLPSLEKILHFRKVQLPCWKSSPNGESGAPGGSVNKWWLKRPQGVDKRGQAWTSASVDKRGRAWTSVDLAPAPPYLPKNDLPRVDGAFNRREREVLGVSHVTRPPSWTAAFEGMGVRPKCADDDPTVKANDATERNGGAAP